jgi:hypothetical protein
MPNSIKKQGSTGSPVQSHSLNLWSIIIIPEIKAPHVPDSNDESTISHISDIDNEMTAAFPKKKKTAAPDFYFFSQHVTTYFFELRGVRIQLYIAYTHNIFHD